MTRKLNTFKKIPLVSALALMSSVAISADFAREEFVMTGTTIDYVDFNLIDQSVIDIATASAWSDPEILLFSGTSSNLGVLLGRDDDSCLSVDCGLVTGQQFNAVIDDIVLESGDYTVVLGANDVTEDEARNDFNEESSAANSVASDVLLKVGDKNMIIAGTATGTGSLEFIGFTEAIRLGQLSNIDGGLQINPNNINAGMAASSIKNDYVHKFINFIERKLEKNINYKIFGRENFYKKKYSKKIDIAVHALKDMPAIETDGLRTNTFLKRNDPREILITKDKKKLKELKSDEDKITGILKKNLPVEDEKILFNKKDKILDIIIPQEIFRAENLPIIKHFIQMDLFKFVLGLEKITFTETYEKPDAKKETKQESKIKDNKK